MFLKRLACFPALLLTKQRQLGQTEKNHVVDFCVDQDQGWTKKIYTACRTL